MRRGLATIALILMAGISILYSQANYSLGIKAGVSLANQSYQLRPIDYTIETEPIVGPAIFLFVEAFRGSHFSFQVDLSYLVKGSKSSTESLTVDHLNNDQIIVNEGEQSTSTFKYLSIAPMARYRMGQGSLLSYFLLGPRLDMLLDYSTDSEYPLENQNGTILGLTLGAGLEYKLEKVGLFTELQFQPDLSPLTNEEPLHINNNIISFTLGLRRLISD